MWDSYHAAATAMQKKLSDGLICTMLNGMKNFNIPEFFVNKPISPLLEMGAYEYLWLQEGQSFKRMAEMFKKHPNTIPSELVSHEDAIRTATEIWKDVEGDPSKLFNIRVHGANGYPAQLRDAKYPVEVLYYKGTWALTETRSVAIVGSRNVSAEGAKRAKAIARMLAESGYTIVSGLAKGVDTAAHTGALEANGKTIAVIGTPITEYYPKENQSLQDLIATEHLLISQVPILKSKSQDFRLNRFFFPERNKTMSALTLATVIVEAGETSGTLVQARAALEQGRKLFIMDSCFRNTSISWPAKYEAQGAIRIHDFEDIKWHLDTV